MFKRIKFHLILLSITLISGCSYKPDYNTDVAYLLPDEKALLYLRTLSAPAYSAECSFYIDTMSAENGKKLPYASFNVEILNNQVYIWEDILSFFKYSGASNSCFIYLGEDQVALKVVTALKSLGVKVP